MSDKLREVEAEVLIEQIPLLHDQIEEWRVRATAAEAELVEARSEITRHHKDFARVQILAERAEGCLDKEMPESAELDIMLANCYWASAAHWVRDIRNIVG